MKILAFNGSPRKNGNTQSILERILAGAVEQGAKTRNVNLNELTFKGCQACYYCKSHDNRCVLKDDLSKLHEEILASDLIVLGTPIFMWQMTGQTKLFVDRLYNFFNINAPSRLQGKKLMVVFTHAQADPDRFRPYIEDFANAMKFMGFDVIETVIAPGVRGPKEVENNGELMERVSELGKKVVNMEGSVSSA